MHTPIGYARVYTNEGKLVGIARSYGDLRQIVGNLAPGTEFEVLLEMNMCAVGNWYYRKAEQGITCSHEYAACSGLHMTLAEVEVRV